MPPDGAAKTLQEPPLEPRPRYRTENGARDYEDFIEKNLDLIVERYHRAELKYRTLYDNSPDLLRTINAEGIIIDCNSTYADSLGYEREEIIGTSIFDHVADQSRAALQDSFKFWKSNGSVRDREIWLRRKDGTSFPTLLSATNLYDRDGNLVGSNTTIRNVTDIYSARREAEEHRAKRISDMGALSSRIAHDLKNPLSVIKNSVELLKIRGANDEASRKDYERIERATVRIAHQIDEVLEYVWPKPLNLSTFSLLGILESVVSKINMQQVRVELPTSDISIVCDGAKIEIVFSNLVLNAVQAMNGMGNVHIRSWDEEMFVKVEVEDTGHGIPQDLIPRIFEPLFTTRQIGTGLGLVSCKSIIERHGGTIEIRSEIDKGTTFVISLPKSPAAGSGTKN